ncbi:MAG: 2-oxoglutarate dehydrogenase E1 component, partial [Catalinimonas sp.]
NKQLIERGEVDAKLAKSMDKAFRGLLQDRLNMVKQNALPYQYQKLEEDWRKLRRSEPGDFEQSPETGVPAEAIETVGQALVRVPKDFKPLKQVAKLLKERQQMFFERKELNWAAAELLAYGSLLLDGCFVRLSGQDSQRGTFSHRHAVLHDAKTNEAYYSLNHLREDQPHMFRIYNSLLSEFGVLGFEFGYSLANPSALVVWEAQFGDFANGAQVMIDQFIACAETKWQRMSGLVLLLPHGYEGQGPEHSNARPERFLQLSAEQNMVVVNVTEPSNFFHLLRRQLAWPFRKPCVVMSPKSLLRHPKVVSPISEFTQGRFRETIDDGYVDKPSVRRVLLCTGKVYYDLLERRQEGEHRDVALIRLEQLHPFPKQQVLDLIGTYPEGTPVVWVQEEPENMGAWAFLLRSFREQPLDVIARRASASPATGYAKVHAEEQKQILDRAFAE